METRFTRGANAFAGGLDRIGQSVDIMNRQSMLDQISQAAQGGNLQTQKIMELAARYKQDPRAVFEGMSPMQAAMEKERLSAAGSDLIAAKRKGVPMSAALQAVMQKYKLSLESTTGLMSMMEQSKALDNPKLTSVAPDTALVGPSGEEVYKNVLSPGERATKMKGVAGNLATILGRVPSQEEVVAFNDSLNKPGPMRELERYANLTPGEQQTYLTIKRAQPNINLNDRVVQPSMSEPGKIVGEFQKGLSPEQEPALKGEQAEATATGKGMGENNMVQYEAASSAVDNIPKIDELINHIKTSDAITGMGADMFKNIERAKALLGSKAAAGKVSDTEILDSMMGSEVFPLIKSLGVGARGLDTPAEREFMRSVLTGSIQLNKETLLRMAEIRRNIAERAVDKWNRRTEAGELDRFYNATGQEKKIFTIPGLEQQPIDDLVNKYLNGNQ